MALPLSQVPNKRLPAEWEESEYIMIAFPDASTDWEYILEEAREQFSRIISTILNAGQKVLLIGRNLDEARKLFGERNIIYSEVDINDTWTRDYGPITIEEEGKRVALDFGFNGWGLKFASNHDNLVNLNLFNKGVIKSERYRNCRHLELEGGSIESDGTGTILTTSLCLCSPNRNGGLSKNEAEERLKDCLGAERVLWLDYGELPGDDTDGHVDTICRFSDKETILYCHCDNPEDTRFEELLKMKAQLTQMKTAEGRQYNLIPLPVPDMIFAADDGHPLPCTYANFLISNKCVFYPVYNQPDNDKRACEALMSAFPDHLLYPIDCSVLVRQNGSLHCSTMQIPKDII